MPEETPNKISKSRTFGFPSMFILVVGWIDLLLFLIWILIILIKSIIGAF